jgi:hypothetical protein
MNSRHTAEIALGVAGVWLIASRMPELGLSVVFSLRDHDGSLNWIVAVSFGAVILFGLGLILLRHRIASWLVPIPEQELKGSAADLQAVAFSVMGVFLLVRGLADFLARLSVSLPGVWGSSSERFAAPLAQVAVGLALFVGSRRLAASWRSLRTGGFPSRGKDDDGAA